MKSTSAQRDAIYAIPAVQSMFHLSDSEMRSYFFMGNLWTVAIDGLLPTRRDQLNNIDLLKIAALQFWTPRGMMRGDLLRVVDQIHSIAENFYDDRAEFLKPRFLADEYILTIAQGRNPIEGVNLTPPGYYRGYWLGSFEHLFPIVRDAAREYWLSDPEAYQRFLLGFDGRSESKTDTF
jgi:hypothetical protein